MNQSKKTHVAQVYYDGRWVSRNNFRVFVYNKDGQKLAKSYDEYLKLIESGLWFSSRDEKETIEPNVVKLVRRGRKPKDGGTNS
jgi:hypothetical protein